MSSHHIVREDQEPALLILDTAATSFRVIEQLLEWSPTVIVSEAVIEQVLSWGIKIDAAILSNSILWYNRLLDQEPIQIVQSSGRPIQDGIDFALSKKYKVMNILVSDKADLDQLSTTPAEIDLVAFHEHYRWSLVRSGNFEKWLTKDTRLAIYPNVKIVTAGLTEQLLVIEIGKIKIESSSCFWVGESISKELV